MKVQIYLLLILGFILLNGIVYAWDISAQFTKTDYEYNPKQLQIFGNIAKDGETYYANLDGSSDNTYTTSYRYCSFDGEYHYYPDAWDIERKYVSPTKYKILVRGGSDKDCGKGQPQNSGWIKLNPESGWKITKVNKCSVSSDTYHSNNKLIDTYCDVDKNEGVIKWQSGSTCIGCCACPDGAGVNIEVIVEKNTTKKFYCGDGICENSSVKVVIDEGDKVTVTVGGVDYIVKLIGVPSNSKAVIEVHDETSGEVQEVRKGNSYTINGLGVYVDGIYYNPNHSSIVLTLGEDNLTCPDDCLKICPAKIVTEFSKSVYYVGDEGYFSTKIYDSNDNLIPNQKFFGTLYINGSELATGSYYTNSQGIYESSGTVDEGLLGENKFVTFVNESNCPYISDIDYFTVLPRNQTCTDSDGGKNYYVKGSCIDSSGKHYDYCAASDKERKVLQEYYCSNNKCYISSYSCPNGCKDGACIEKEKNETVYCGDGICNGNETPETCPEDCKLYCTDSDGGKNYYVKGTTESCYMKEGEEICKVANDFCEDDKTLKEYYCEGNKIESESYTCPNGCKDGACIISNQTCIDSDGGKNYYVKGTTYGNFPDGTPITRTDRCKDESLLLEYYCYPQGGPDYFPGAVGSIDYTCPNGCRDGACIKENETVHSLKLYKGWNMISSPVNRAISISEIEGNCKLVPYKGYKVWYWDTYSGTWTHPTVLDPGLGYYVKVEEDCTANIIGKKFEFEKQKIYKGWNMIAPGKTSLEEILGTCKNHLIPYKGYKVWRWNPKTNSWEHPTDFKLGQGYYIKSDADCELSKFEIPFPTGKFLWEVRK